MRSLVLYIGCRLCRTEHEMTASGGWRHSRKHAPRNGEPGARDAVRQSERRPRNARRAQLGYRLPSDVRRAPACGSIAMSYGKWLATRSAAERWGTTIRFSVISAVIEAPVILWLVVRR